MSGQFAAAGCQKCHTFHLIGKIDESGNIVSVESGLHKCHGCGKLICRDHGGWLTPQSDTSLKEKIWMCDSCMGVADEEPILMNDETVERLAGSK